MKDIFKNYIQSISLKFSHEETTEMGYRADLEFLLKKIFEIIKVQRIDHDPKAKKHNKPDFVVLKFDIPILYLEAKDIGTSLDKIEKSEQMSRYFGYANLVLTDYVEFRFYRNGLSYGEPIKIAEYDRKRRTITSIPERYKNLAQTLVDFTKSHKEPIRSGEHLSKIMGGKAQRIRDNIRQFYSSESNQDTDLIKLFKTIKQLLVHDLTIHSFSDMYAQTLVYGLFVARYYDKSLSSFSRQEARELIPNSNPLLRHFFDHIVGADFDTRLKYIVDELCEVFSHADVKELMKQYFKLDLWGKTHRGPDPVIHFYEDFLNEYDPILRKKMGAYYTPLPIVEFIIRSVDYLLKKEFGLTAGLVDTSKTKEGLHKVQILDPACGTGTFISSIIRKIYLWLETHGQKGRWPTYVHHDLLPRLFGFELMMAPYTIAHLKLGIAFRQTGFWDFHRRLGIYLTNSLEESFTQQQSLFALGLAESIAEESKEASKIKNEKPIMVIVGNPPYSGVSSNETKYANSLVERYKFEPGGKQKLQERKHWLNDDYVKFLAMAESMIEKNGEGIVAMITNNSYLDNPTFRGMRWHLTKTFDKIYVLDLHGNAKKKETAPGGGRDENVFDIMQGVGIILAIKTKRKRLDQSSEVFHADLYGTRKYKFNELTGTPKWQKLTLDSKMFYFVSKNTKGQEEYEKGFKLDELFPKNVTGIVTMGDNFIVNERKDVIAERVQKLARCEYDESTLNASFNLGKNYAKFVLDNCKQLNFEESKIVKLNYRPFDEQWTYFDNKVIWRWRENVMKHLLKNNVSINFCRQVISDNFSHILVSNHLMDDSYVSNKSRERGYCAPLYIYHADGSRTPNLSKEIVDKFRKIVSKISPEDVFDYVYAVLHSTSYREKYKEFLKIDFPRVPYPKNKSSFSKLIKLGSELRTFHLLESPKVNKFITTYPVAGSDTVEKRPNFKNGKVFINDEQYFGNVPKVAWSFYIGGYQPAQKWLKDHKGLTLNNSDLEHYQKIIVALTETDRIMNEIDKVFTI